MGRIKKGISCSIKGCEEKSNRSFSIEKVQNALSKAGLEIDPGSGRRVVLCQLHYRKIKKYLKQDTQVERMRFAGKKPHQVERMRFGGI